MKSQPKLTLIEKLIIGWGIPINTLGYVLKNQTNFFQTSRFYWNHKLNKYSVLLTELNESEDISKLAEKYMPVLCYRMMFKLALKRTGRFSKENYSELSRKIPLDLDRSFNPKYIPKKENEQKAVYKQ